MSRITNSMDGNDSWVIRPIRPEEVTEARRLIYCVAHEFMEPYKSLEEMTDQWDAWGVFDDLDDVQEKYIENGGVFLVTVSGGQLVGTGAFHWYAEGVCEARRITLLPAYRRRGLGYAMLMELQRLARAMGYSKMCLWTNPIKLWRAVTFYHRLGFVEVAHEGADEDELWMEIELTPEV